MSFLSVFSISLIALLAENVVFAQYLGITSILDDSDNEKKALKTGTAVTVILVISSLVAYIADGLILKSLGLDYLRTVVLVLTTVSVTQLCEFLFKNKNPELYKKSGISSGLVTSNCVILGVLLINSENGYNLIEALFSALFSGIGFIAAITLLAAVRRRLEYCDVPKCLEGIPITLITAGLIALAFMGFRGMKLI